MNCPIDQSELQSEKFHNIDIDRCPQCHGMWLDYAELDALEDQVMTDDHAKGTLIFSTAPSNLACPKCGELLKSFDYRLYNLQLEVCPQLHGFWLDRGEEDRVLELMQKEEQGEKRIDKAQADWANELQALRSPGFVNSIKNLFK